MPIHFELKGAASQFVVAVGGALTVAAIIGVATLIVSLSNFMVAQGVQNETVTKAIVSSQQDRIEIHKAIAALQASTIAQQETNRQNEMHFDQVERRLDSGK